MNTEEATYQNTTKDSHGVVRVTINQEEMIITKLFGDHLIATVVMTRKQARELLEFLIEGLSRTDDERNPDELVGDFMNLYTLLYSLDNLREIETDEILLSDTWQPALDAANKAQEALASLVDDAYEELADHYDRASTVADDEDEDEEEEESLEDDDE
jgi:hypothetical protein